LLEIARGQTRLSRRRLAAWSAAASILLMLGVWVALAGAGRRAQAPEAWNVAERTQWTRGIFSRPNGEALTGSEERRLRDYLGDSSSAVRRGALLALSARYGREIPPAILHGIFVDLQETIDLPEQFASVEDSDLAMAFRMNRRRTARAVAGAIWSHCARHHTYPDLEMIELLSTYPDEDVRASAYRALGEIKSYRPTKERLEQVREETGRVQEAARKLPRKH